MCTPGLKGLIFFMYCREQKQKQTLRTKTNLKKKRCRRPKYFLTQEETKEKREKEETKAMYITLKGIGKTHGCLH